MPEIKWENPELWELCMRHGEIIIKREKVAQLAILDLYDEILELLEKQKGKKDVI